MRYKATRLTRGTLTWLPQPGFLKFSDWSWLFPDYSLTNVKFLWPTELPIAQISPDNKLNARSPHRVLKFHFFLTSFNDWNFPWLDFFLTLKNFFPWPFSACGNHVSHLRCFLEKKFVKGILISATMYKYVFLPLGFVCLKNKGRNWKQYWDENSLNGPYKKSFFE